MLPHFINQPELIQCPDGRNFRLGLDATSRCFGFWSPRTGVVSVPGGFITDLASIPRLFWNILPPFGKYTEAAVIHDYLYRTHLTSRAVADRTLLEGMRLCHVSRWQRVVIYVAVRLFGGIPWNDDARRNFNPKSIRVNSRNSRQDVYRR
jgi:Protein of unknown function (DUF1353)